MGQTNNVLKGNQLVVLVRDALDTVYEVLGGVKTRGLTIDNPGDDTTSSSTTGEFSESEFTGYTGMTVNISGNDDKRTGTTDPATGLNIVGTGRISTIALSGNRCEKFKILNLDTNGFLEGILNVSNFQKTGDTPGLLGFSATLSSQSDVVLSGEI